MISFRNHREGFHVFGPSTGFTGRYRAMSGARPWGVGFLALALSGLALTGCQSYGSGNYGNNTAKVSGNVYENASQPQWGSVKVPRYRKVSQPPGRVVMWVMPGPRELSPDVFGTPKHPKDTCKAKFAAAEHAVAAHKMPPTVPELLHKLPILVCVPLKARHLHADGTWWMDQPTPFSDHAQGISGSFTAQFWQYTTKNPPGPPSKTPNKSKMKAKFTDPQGHHYRVVLRKVLKPPFPGYNTDGGVMIDSYHHGLTGTGSPLMPKVKTYAANWGACDVYIDGNLADHMAVCHMMTTEMVRTRTYHLALNNQMPLPPKQWFIPGQATETHLIVLPAQVTPKGPVFKPLKTAFKLPNGKTQPFMHIMYEQDIVGPVKPLESKQ